MLHHPLQAHRPAALALALSLAFGVAPALAQTASSDDQTLRAVTVTGSGVTEGSGSYGADTARSATRMELSPRETPQSVTVITRERMDDQGSSSIDSLLGLTTGIMIGQNDSERTNFYARGFSINNFQIDGMPRGPNAPLQDTYLWDRVEVVRGATGLMGGTGDPSATINMVRKRPTKTFQGNAAVRLGRWNDRRVEADLSTPITADGRVRGRVVLAHQDRESYMDRYQEKKTLGMAIVEADLTSNTLLTAGVDFQHNKPLGATWGAVPYWTSFGTLANLPRNTSLSSTWSTWANEQETAFGSLQHRFDNGWRVHAGYNRTTSRNNTKVAYAGSGYPNPLTGEGMSLWTGVWGESSIVNDNYDLYATGPFSLLGRTHTLIAGWNGGNQTSSTMGGRSYQAYDAKVPNYLLWTGSLPEPAFVEDGSRTIGTLRLTGGYGAVRFNVADGAHVIVGARTSNYRTRTHAYNSYGAWTRTTGVLEVKDEVTPYVGLTYDLTSQLSVYASHTSLFKPQSYKDRNEQFLKPITGSASEVGIKGEFMGGLLNASGAIFQSKQKNIAELDPSVSAGFRLSDGSQAYRADADGITARGLELEVAGQLTPDWNVTAGYTYLQARTAKGERAVPNQPRHLLQLSTAYRFSGALQGLKVGGSMRAQSDIYGISWYGQPPLFSMSPAPRIPQKGYAVFDVMASYQITPQLTAQLNITNLLDKKYYRNVGFYDSVFWGEPRNVKVSLKATF